MVRAAISTGLAATARTMVATVKRVLEKCILGVCFGAKATGFDCVFGMLVIEGGD